MSAKIRHGLIVALVLSLSLAGGCELAPPEAIGGTVTGPGDVVVVVELPASGAGVASAARGSLDDSEVEWVRLVLTDAAGSLVQRYNLTNQQGIWGVSFPKPAEGFYKFTARAGRTVDGREQVGWVGLSAGLIPFSRDIVIKLFAPTLRGPGPAAGFVIYDKARYSDGWRYLEAAFVDCPGTCTWFDAVTQCNNLVAGGFDDWYLPPFEHLYTMYQWLAWEGLGSFTTDAAYWSSDEGPMTGFEEEDPLFIGAAILDFPSGKKIFLDKNYDNGNTKARAVRAF